MYPDTLKSEYSPIATLHQMIGGAMVSQMLAQAARLAIADQLAAGPLGTDELARRVGAHPTALYRTLRALASCGVFKENADASFELTPIGALLRDDVPGSLRMWAMMNGSPWYWKAMGHAGYSITTGEPSFEEIFGKGTFQYFQDNPEAGALFYATMSRFSNELIPHLLSSYDFSSYKHLIDVGGGHGTLLSAILDAVPTIKGTLFDLPFVINAVAQRHNLSAPPFNLASGDFFESVPAGGDGYLLKYIIHDWNDEQAERILLNCRKAMGETGRVLLFEHVVRPPNEPCSGKMLDLTMLLLEGGRERNAEEFTALFARAGLQLSRIIPVLGSFSVVEGVPA